MPSWCRVNLQPPSWTRSGHDRFRGHHPDTRGWVVAENVGRRGDSWSYRLELPPGPDGRQRQKRVGGFATERQANAALATAQVEVSRGRPQYAPVRTFADLAEEWLTVVGPNRKETTLANYRDLVNAYLLPNLGALRLDRLATAQIQRLYVTLRERGGCDGRPRSGTHVRNVHRVLHNALGSAVKMGYLSTNRPTPSSARRTTRQNGPCTHLTRYVDSSTRSRAIACAPCGISPSSPGSGAASSQDCDGPISTSPRGRRC